MFCAQEGSDIMALEYRVIGPPGTGKTTTIRNRVARWVRDGDYEPEHIVLTSFSRSAAQELAGAVSVPPENVSTLHSLARRAIGSAPIAEVMPLSKEWDESGIPPQWRLNQGKTADLEDGLMLNDASGVSLARYSLARSMNLPQDDPVWKGLSPFETAWEKFKEKTGSVDFTDMIVNAINTPGACPSEPPVIMVDEAQDLTPIQWSLVRKWAAHPSVEKFFVMGDPAQAIYSFAGARPEEMLTPLAPGQQHVLNHSYRMPRAIQAHAEKYLSRHSGTIMDGRHYTPRDEEGVVRHLSVNWKKPAILVDEINRVIRTGRTVMILATCSYMLDQTIYEMRQRGLMFQNQWRKANHKWNPISVRTDVTTRTMDRVQAFYRGESPHLWVPMLSADVYAMRGGKKHVMDAPEEWEAWFKPEHVMAARLHDMKWLEQYAMREFEHSVSYAARIISFFGVDALEDKIRISIGTIHSVKGGEADVVYVFPDVSTAGAEEMGSQTGRDAAIRLGYVAMSRARQELVICDTAGSATPLL